MDNIFYGIVNNKKDVFLVKRYKKALEKLDLSYFGAGAQIVELVELNDDFDDDFKGIFVVYNDDSQKILRLVQSAVKALQLQNDYMAKLEDAGSDDDVKILKVVE